GPDDPQGLLDLLTDPAIRLVSLTVTEGGYNVHPVTGEFVSDDPAIVADVEALRAGAAPATVFGYVVSALQYRREQGIEPFTVQSCDNISHNGRVAKQMFSAFGRLVAERLAEWLDAAVACPASVGDQR